MADENKFIKLRAIGYEIPMTCGICHHSRIKYLAEWGTCALHHYFHVKHDNPPEGREISIHRLGSCPSHQMDKHTYVFGAHSEFLKPR